MSESERKQHQIINAIAHTFDLEPKHFTVKWNPNNLVEPVEIAGTNVMALAYGRHKINLTSSDWKAEPVTINQKLCKIDREEYGK